jgi:hypothetical protein
MSVTSELDSFDNWTADKVYPTLQTSINLSDFSFIGNAWNRNGFKAEVLSQYPVKGGAQRFFGYFSGFFNNTLTEQHMLDLQTQLKLLNLYLVSENILESSVADNILGIYINRKLPESLEKGFCLPYFSWVQFVLDRGGMTDTFDSLKDFDDMYADVSNSKFWNEIQINLSAVCNIPFYSRRILSSSIDWGKGFLSRDPKFLSYCLANGVVPMIREPGLTLYVDNPFSIHYHRMAFISKYVSDLIDLDPKFGVVLSFACVPSSTLMRMIQEIQDYFVVADKVQISSEL